MSKHKNIINLLERRGKKIDIDGNIHKNNNHVYICYFMFIFIYMVNYIVYHNKQFTRCQFLLHETSYYSKFVEYVLRLNNASYVKVYKPYMNNISYVSNNQLVMVNPMYNDFEDGEVPLIPLSDEEIEELEKHTGLKNLTRCQNKILHMSPKINAYQIINDKYDFGEKITTISPTKINNYKWDLVLSDDIEPLKVNDVMNATFFDAENKSIFIEKKYILDNEYTLLPLSGDMHSYIQQLPFYSLDTPRPILRFHPFHLPQTIDIVLTLMILAQACIDNT